MIKPETKITSAQVEDAWQAYRAMQRLASGDPKLRDNAYFKALQETAYARFLLNLEAL